MSTTAIIILVGAIVYFIALTLLERSKQYWTETAAVALYVLLAIVIVISFIYGLGHLLSYLST